MPAATLMAALTCTEEGCSLGDCPRCQAVHALAGTPPEPDSRTLAECLSSLDAILSRVSMFRNAVHRLSGDRELTVARLDYMAANIREAIRDGDRAAQSWRAGS